MSYFNVPSINRNGDIKKVYSYIMLLNQQLQYCFANINPEDNFSLEAMVKYSETDEKVSQFELNMDNFIAEFRNKTENIETSIRIMNNTISMKVSADELCSEISLSPDTITFETGQLIIDAENMKLYADGSAEFNGSITGGSINIADQFVVNENGGATIASSTFTKKITCNGLLYTNYMRIGGDADIDGTVNCNAAKVDGTVSCEELYQTSDRRLKENIERIPDQTALDAVLGLRPVKFRYRKSGVESMGFIAQEVEAMKNEKGLDLPMTDTINDYLAIPYGSYGALYAGAIREQQRQIEELEKILKEEFMV